MGLAFVDNTQLKDAIREYLIKDGFNIDLKKMARLKCKPGIVWVTILGGYTPQILD